MKARESSHWKNPWKNNILNVFLLNWQFYMCVVMIFTPLPCIVKLFLFPPKPSIWSNPPMAIPLKKTAHYLHSNHNIILHSYLLLLCVYDYTRIWMALFLSTLSYPPALTFFLYFSFLNVPFILGRAVNSRLYSAFWPDLSHKSS